MEAQDVVVGSDGLLSSREVMARSGITFRQLDDWCRKGVLRTEGAATPGSGMQRRFDPAEAEFARVLGCVPNRGGGGAPWLRTLLHQYGNEIRAAIEQGAEYVVLTDQGVWIDSVPAASGFFLSLV